jgi:hypothetical protein
MMFEVRVLRGIFGPKYLEAVTVCCQVEILSGHSSRGILPSVVCLSVILKPQQGGGVGPLRLSKHEEKEELTGDRRRLHNEGIHDLHSSPNIIGVTKLKKNEMGGACVPYGGEEGCVQGFGGKPSGT